VPRHIILSTLIALNGLLTKLFVNNHLANDIETESILWDIEASIRLADTL